jgi:Undecaprenyl-phosphate glucose phosphotransferase
MNQFDPRARLRATKAVAVKADILQKLNAPEAGLTSEARAAAVKLAREALSPTLVSGFFRLIEGTAIALIGLAIHQLYIASRYGTDFYYVATVLAGSILAVALIQMTGGYSVTALKNPRGHIGKIVIAWTLVFAAFAVAAFLAKLGEEYSRVWFGSWYLTGLAAIIGLRIGGAKIIRDWIRSGRLERRAVIVGGGAPTEALIRAIVAQHDNDIRICGIFDDRGDDRSPRSVAGYPKLGTISELVAFGRIAKIDLLIISLPITAENRLLEVFKQLWVLPVDIRLSAHTNKLHFRPRSYSFIGSVPFLDVADKPIADWDYIAKSLFDHIVGGLILLLALPVMAAVAVAIKLDSKGPVLFRQKRYGFNNELIEVYKFRSMYTDMSDAAAAKLVTKDDPRVTRVGRFIRKTSLDELPQLFNVVFKGDLSLVGPRPHALQAKADSRLYDEVVDGYFARHRVKPGITGWAQINGWRGETDTAEKIQQRVSHDLYYIENWSVLFDLKILAMTPIRLLKSENAY